MSDDAKALPGVSIRWTPNPLRSVVELDDAGKLLLWHRIKIDELIGRIVAAHVDLTWDSPHNNKPLEERVVLAGSRLDPRYVCNESKHEGQTLDEYVDELLADAIQELAGEHYGDCTCVACSCSKCRAEGLLGIDTTRGLGKHEGSKIAGAFSATDGGEAVTIDEAIARLRDYRPAFCADHGWKSEADFNQHVPRWIEEGRRAHAWLEAYRHEHFATSDAPTELYAVQK